ncbi:nuclear transport factor 2 family protein [Rapidithrix thailandica]|uniref:Nuclear transport factor 2 family protein n=1 Tax=Rapidithrix thailandica TaxID=413964 RepID=A0AAW9SDP8_9BACT
MNKVASIVAVEKALLSAMKNSDTQTLDELLHDDLLFNLPNGDTITKAMDLETYRSGNMIFDEILSSEQQIRLIENNAVVSVTIEMKGTFFDQNIDAKFHIIRVWQLGNDTWKVIAGSSMKL